MPHAPFLSMNWGHPASLRHVDSFPVLGLLRRLRCLAGYSASSFLSFYLLKFFHLAALRIAGLLRPSGLGNLQLDILKRAYCDVGVGFRPFPLTAAGCHKHLAVCVYMSHSAITYGEYNHPAPSGRVSRLGLPLKQFSLDPHSQYCVLPLSRG